MKPILSNTAQELIRNETTLPESIVDRLSDICPQQPDPEPYRDGTYGDYCEVSLESLRSFLSFHRKAVSLGHPGVSPGRGEDDLGIQFLNPTDPDTYLSVCFLANGSVRALKSIAGTKIMYNLPAQTDLFSEQSIPDLSYFVRTDAANLLGLAELASINSFNSNK